MTHPTTSASRRVSYFPLTFPISQQWRHEQTLSISPIQHTRPIQFKRIAGRKMVAVVVAGDGDLSLPLSAVSASWLLFGDMKACFPRFSILVLTHFFQYLTKIFFTRRGEAAVVCFPVGPSAVTIDPTHFRPGGLSFHLFLILPFLLFFYLK